MLSYAAKEAGRTHILQSFVFYFEDNLMLLKGFKQECDSLICVLDQFCGKG